MERDKIIVKTSIIGILTNIVLVIFKIIVGLFVNSIAIILDGVNNLSDVLSSTVTIIGTKLAKKAPDKEHPYGHGRIEYFSAVVIAVIILLAGVMALKESIEKIINPLDANYSLLSMIIIVIAIFTKYFLGNYVKKKGYEVNSSSLVASGTDAHMDVILSLSTLVAAVINYMWNIGLEGYIGVIISIVILRSSFSILKESVNSILGVRVDSSISKKVKTRLMEFDEVLGVSDLNIHNYGPINLVGSVHIQVRSDMTAEEIHIMTRQMTYVIYKEFGINMIIGIYASNTDGEFDNMKNDLINISKNYEHALQIHGFYVDKKTSNVYFDLIISFDADNKKEIKHSIIEKMKELYPEYNYNVMIDMDITD